MRTSVKVGAALAGAALLAASAAAPASAKSPWTKTGASIVGTAVSASGGIGAFDDNSSDYDLLIAALVGTGLVAAFDGTEYTVFAPNDGAFIKAADALSPDSITTEAQAAAFFTAVLTDPTDDFAGKKFVSNVLLTHVVAGTRPAASVVRGQVLTTLNGEKLQFKDGTLNADGSSATILAPNLKATDGAIHVIDTVLLP